MSQLHNKFLYEAMIGVTELVPRNVNRLCRVWSVIGSDAGACKSAEPTNTGMGSAKRTLSSTVNVCGTLSNSAMHDHRL